MAHSYADLLYHILFSASMRQSVAQRRMVRRNVSPRLISRDIGSPG